MRILQLSHNLTENKFDGEDSAAKSFFDLE